MADISKIKTLDGTTYNIKDAKAVHNVYDGLDSSSADDALSANMGKLLNSNIVKSIASGTDLNTITEPGFYNFADVGTLVNAPVEGTNRLGLIVQRSENNTFATQLAFENLQRNYGVYFRRCLIGNWSSWEKFALDSNIVNGESVTITASSGMTVDVQYLKKHGSIVTGTVIMSISASANAETEIATIPLGSRPAISSYIPVYMNSTGLFNQTASLEIRSNGKIILWTTQNISSKQVSFTVSYHV